LIKEINMKSECIPSTFTYSGNFIKNLVFLEAKTYKKYKRKNKKKILRIFADTCVNTCTKNDMGQYCNIT